MADFVTARYEHPDGKPRLSYRRDYPRGFPAGPCNWKGQGGKAAACSRTDPHKHVWTKGKYAGTLPKIWGEDDGTGPLVLVEGEKDAQAVQEAGYIAVSLMGGALHAGKSDFGVFANRDALIWPDRDAAGSKFAGDAIPKMREAGVSTVRALAAPNCPQGWGCRLSTRLSPAGHRESPCRPPFAKLLRPSGAALGERRTAEASP